MQFAIILNGFGQKMNKQLNRVFKFGLNIKPGPTALEPNAISDS